MAGMGVPAVVINALTKRNNSKIFALFCFHAKAVGHLISSHLCLSGMSKIKSDFRLLRGNPFFAFKSEAVFNLYEPYR